MPVLKLHMLGAMFDLLVPTCSLIQDLRISNGIHICAVRTPSYNPDIPYGNKLLLNSLHKIISPQLGVN